MQNAEIKNNLIIFNNNPAGYIKNQIATVDTMFTNKELEQWLEDNSLTVKWQDGVFEKLALNRKFYETELAEPLKNVRIWQLKANFDIESHFVSYAEMEKKHGEPNIENYAVLFDGELQTNDLEEIYTIFNQHHPQGFEGHSLSMSDVVELYDDNVSEFHYVDRFGFKGIQFNLEEQAQEMGIQIQM